MRGRSGRARGSFSTGAPRSRRWRSRAWPGQRVLAGVAGRKRARGVDRRGIGPPISAPEDHTDRSDADLPRAVGPGHAAGLPVHSHPAPRAEIDAEELPADHLPVAMPPPDLLVPQLEVR